MKLVDNLYKAILNAMYNHCIVHINEKVKNIICLIAAHCLAAIYIFYRMDISIKDKLNIGSFDIACFIFFMLIILVLFSMKRQITIDEDNKISKIIYCCFAITMLVALIVANPIWEIKVSMLMVIFIFPAFYYISQYSNDYATLVKIIAISFANIGLILHIGNFLLYPYEDTSIAYQAGFANPNTLAMALVPTFLCSIYLFSICNRIKWLYLVIAGYTIGIIMLCEARTSIAVCLISLICWGIYYIIHSSNFEIKRINSLVSVILAICILAAGVFITDKVNVARGTTAINDTIAVEETTIEPAEEANSLEKVITKSEERTGTNLNGFLSGRVELWKYYTKDITAFGHDYDSAKEQRTEDNITLGTHNTLISYLYICGAIPALIMLIIQLLVAGYIIRRIFFKYKTEEIERKNSLPQLDLFIVLIAPAYCLAGLVEELIWVSRWAIAALFFISLAPIFYKRKFKR
ncbi:hypothetical protein [Gallibacter intestinalis]|uniref:O-antigen polymerase n=1 Tax=Gallibacter intestinalis TaxID=2779356 RepID=A0ABR9QV49_9FIRM|nr:hypothetical protein [Gallibacter intestinalis]MBE5034748.1 hypothetical protein [Gallibacter intestinalis]